MNRKFLKDATGWGLFLWLIGYGLGIALFAFVSPALIGWIITPIGTLLALWVLFKKVDGKSVNYYTLVGMVWLLIAVLGDYFLLYKTFQPEDGYYKLDVYIYYGLTFVLPIAVGWYKVHKRNFLKYQV